MRISGDPLSVCAVPQTGAACEAASMAVVVMVVVVAAGLVRAPGCVRPGALLTS